MTFALPHAMLQGPTSDKRRARFRRFGRALLLRVGRALVASMLLAFATPGTAEIVEQTIAVVTGTEAACSDPCGVEGHSEEDCDDGCEHCACCAPFFVVAVTTSVLDEASAERTALFGFHRGAPYASGFRTAPFRPPSA